MFDEQNQNPNAPQNLPTEPIDMFAGVEKDESVAPLSVPDALSIGLLKKKDEVIATPPSSAPIGGGGLPPVNQGVDVQNYQMRAPILGKILLFLAVILLLAGLGYGGWRLFYGSKNKSVEAPIVPANEPGAADTSANIPAQINNDQILFGQAVDSDKDGLDDVREKEIGANPQNADSDGDGLSDGDEVIIYKTDPLKADTDSDGLSDGDEALIWRTNPLNSDTDGDSYPDGTEVRNGYNPLGAGKLFSSPSTTTSTT